MTPITYRTIDVNGLKVFYRESGPPDVPKLLLLAFEHLAAIADTLNEATA